MEGRERGETLIFQGFWRVWPQKTVAWIGESASTEGSDPSVEAECTNSPIQSKPRFFGARPHETPEKSTFLRVCPHQIQDCVVKLWENRSALFSQKEHAAMF